ncbi:hypothetical protein [Micromonospora sp. DH14]|uniref:hypothetical protein n=1 Tax=Micromonospora sp. DH14 TaxID=3040120 RepID=UPI0024428445|nr:hypothetical protein [Micromonospora sp. DH14]MDG9676194.1 hypothetical protein [Micromonospora sp. DH14]
MVRTRVKGRTENAIVELLPNGYAARPGFIQPTYGALSRTRAYRIGYAVTRPLFPVLRVVREGSPTRVLGNRELR